MMFRQKLLNFFDASSFAREFPHVGDLVAADLTVLDHFDFGNRGGIDREGAFHTDTSGDLTDGEGRGDPRAAALHNDAFEDLVTFLLVLDDTDVDLDGVAAREVRNILAKLTGSDLIDKIVVHGSFLLQR